jgi:hypothetical protein
MELAWTVPGESAGAEKIFRYAMQMPFAPLLTRIATMSVHEVMRYRRRNSPRPARIALTKKKGHSGFWESVREDAQSTRRRAIAEIQWNDLFAGQVVRIRVLEYPTASLIVVPPVALFSSPIRASDGTPRVSGWSRPVRCLGCDQALSGQ